MSKEIELTKGRVAIVDDADYEFLNQWNWFALFDKRRESWYAARKGPRKHGRQPIIYMHRVLLSVGPGLMVDHKDSNGLNNCRSNLRPANNAQNQWNCGKSIRNTSGHKGVRWYKAKQKWRAVIRVSGEIKHLGYFIRLEDAAKAYAAAAKEFHGEFAHV